eukprot:747310-Hanusia_phi.AAC.2
MTRSKCSVSVLCPGSCCGTQPGISESTYLGTELDSGSCYLNDRYRHCRPGVVTWMMSDAGRPVTCRSSVTDCQA